MEHNVKQKRKVSLKMGHKETNNFILFHSILHGRQPPQEYGIKLLLHDEEEQYIVVSARGDTKHMLHNQVAAHATIKYYLFPIRDRNALSHVCTSTDTLVLYLNTE